MAATADLTRRLAVALVGLPLVILVLIRGGWWLGAVVALMAALGTREFYALTQACGARPFRWVGALTSAALVLLVTAQPTPGTLLIGAVPALVLLTLALIGASVWRRWPEGRPTAAVGATLVGVLYIGGPLAFAPLLRELPHQAGVVGPGAVGWAPALFVALPLAITWVGDSSAYFAGRAFGRRPLAPAASPAKTIEGALAGLIGSMLAAVVFTQMVPPEWTTLRVPPLLAAVVGGVAGAAGQVGDLAESVFKREAGVKDSGGLLPGHGGLLDRLDSLVFAIPVTWLALIGLGIGKGTP